MLQVYIETLLQGYIHDVPSEILTSILQRHLYSASWLVGCFGFKGPLRQYFSLHRAVSQREGERRERVDESKNVQTTPTRTYCKRNRPLPYCNQNYRTPRHWKFTQHHCTIRPTLTQLVYVLAVYMIYQCEGGGRVVR